MPARTNFKQSRSKKKLTKVCSKCKVEKEVSEFSKSSNTNDLLQSYCKICMNEYWLTRTTTPPKRVHRAIPQSMFDFITELNKGDYTVFEKTRKFSRKYHIKLTAAQFNGFCHSIKKGILFIPPSWEIKY